MMKKILLVVLLSALLSHTGVFAQVRDAFSGILPVTDPQMMQSLNGVWMLDGKEIPVPGCWEAYGFSKPSYDKADDLVKEYTTTFTVPQKWQGHCIALRFDGVLYGYDLYVNGQEAGSWRSGYNTAVFDITPVVDWTKERQELSLRVMTRFRGSDFDYNDDWAPCGIFRDVTLMAVPKVHLSDVTITTKNNGEVKVNTVVSGGNGKVRYTVTDSYGRIVAKGKGLSTTLLVGNPELWTAETPSFYTLTTTLQANGQKQVHRERFGFRELTIEGNVLKLNGQPIKLRGVTSHSTDPVTVKVISEESILRDMKLMKEASVNYIRTSHYPREPRFYELADSLGFYVIDEVPFGFGDKNLYDSTFYPILQQRAQATIRRDKNHPSVLVWSLGNENPLTEICSRLGDYVSQELDPSRPYCFPQVGSYFRKTYDARQPVIKAPIYAPHYPTTGQISGYYQHLDRPVIFTEYCHTLGISLEDHDRQWETIQRTPGIAGGSVWEWVDQGMPFRDTLQSRFGYEERVFTSEYGGFEMYGNKGTDGLLYADRTPLPNYYELQRNYARAFVSNVNGDTLTIVNRYDFLDLKDNVTFDWMLRDYSADTDEDSVTFDAFSPQCAPHDSVRVVLPLSKISSFSVLDVSLTDKDGNTFLRQCFARNKPDFSALEISSEPTDAPQFLIRVGRKATMAERIKVADKRVERYLQPVDNPYVKAGISTSSEGNAIRVDYELMPDTTDRFLSEVGIAWLLPENIDRVQWVGMGPFASYPGRSRANNYDIWSLHKDDVYFEGNRMGIDAAFLSDKDGNGILVVGDSLNLNFEQTDRGIVLTVNAAVAGQGPKFSRTAFPVVSKDVGRLTGTFRMSRVEGGKLPPAFDCLFDDPQYLQKPFKPFLTQYDTYLMRYEDIVE